MNQLSQNAHSQNAHSQPSHDRLSQGDAGNPDGQPGFLADSDAAIHRELSRRSHALGHHPFLERLHAAFWSPHVVAAIYRHRKSVVDNFLPLLDRAQAMAEQAGRRELAAALHANLCDEHGLDPTTGEPTGKGTHREWGRWLQQALDELDPPQSNPCVLPDLNPASWNLHPTSEQDSLALIVGMAMAVEKCVPLEFHAFLVALSAAFPSLADPDQPEKLVYLVDHIDHDERRHLPDLIDGFLGHAPGSKAYQLPSTTALVEESADLLRGIERVVNTRLAFYDQLAQVVGDRR